MTRQAEVGPSSGAGGGDTHMLPAHLDAGDKGDVHLDNEGERDKDLRIGPA